MLHDIAAYCLCAGGGHPGALHVDLYDGESGVVRRDVERARMEKEDMRCKMVELSTRTQMDHEKIIQMPNEVYWSWRGYSHGMTRWLDYVLNGRYDPMFR